MGHLQDFVSEITTSKIPQFPRNELRCSSLPYCPILDIMHQGEEQFQEYGMAFYTSMGTAYHETAQAHAVAGKYGKYIYGDWEVYSEKDGTVEKSIVRNVFRPNPTRIRGIKTFPKYLEVSIKYKNLGGHCDMVWKYKGEWYLLDFKTTSNAVADSKNSGYYPDSKHVVQLSAYVFLLRQVGIDIKHVCLLYVSRNKMQEWVPSLKKKVDAYKIVPFEPEEAVWEHVKNACKSRKAVIRFMNGDDSALSKVIKYKPCQQPSDYFTGIMECKFFGNEKCPYMNKCFGKKLKRMLKEQRDMVNEGDDDV